MYCYEGEAVKEQSLRDTPGESIQSIAMKVRQFWSSHVGEMPLERDETGSQLYPSSSLAGFTSRIQTWG